MNKLKRLVLGVVAIGALLGVAGQMFPAQATALRTLTLNVLTSTSGTITTLVSTTFSAATVSATGAISTTGGGVKASSSTSSNLPLVLDGMYTTAQIQAKTPSAVGQLVYNVTLGNVCVSTGSATAQAYKLVGTASTTCQ